MGRCLYNREAAAEKATVNGLHRGVKLSARGRAFPLCVARTAGADAAIQRSSVSKILFIVIVLLAILAILYWLNAIESYGVASPVSTVGSLGCISATLRYPQAVESCSKNTLTGNYGTTQGQTREMAENRERRYNWMTWSYATSVGPTVTRLPRPA